MRVLVTGANGFLGRRVVIALQQRRFLVRTLDLAAADPVKSGWGTDVEQFPADLCQCDRLDEAMSGVDAVIHLAAQMRGDDASRITSTVEGTRRLLDAMEGRAVRRLVLASSYSVYDWEALGGTLDEESPLEVAADRRDGYAVAKVRQEQLVVRRSRENCWKLTVMRPGAMWGPGSPCMAVVGQKVGPACLVFGPARPLPLIHVENCAHAFAAVVDSAEAEGRVFNVVDEVRVSAWRHLGEHLARSGNRGVRIPVPYLPLRLGVAMAYGCARALGLDGRLPSMLVPPRFDARFKPVVFAESALRAAIGWMPPLSYEEALARTYGTASATSS